jgi:hypothetical protein
MVGLESASAARPKGELLMRAILWKTVIFGVVTAVSFSTTAQGQTKTSRPLTNETRLFQHFIEDGAVTENVWLEGQFRYQSFSSQDLLSVGSILAVNIAEDIEVGGRFSLKTVDPDGGGRETGFSDMDIYGKIRITTEPTQLALGILLKLPTGDEEKSLSLGTGEMDVAFFGGLRHSFGAVSLVANAGLRINQDPDPLPAPGQPPFEGETSIQLGGGLLFAMTERLSGIIETSFETERINGAGSDFRVTVGGDFRQAESFAFRVGVAGGGGDGAPDVEIITSGVFYF